MLSKRQRGTHRELSLLGTCNKGRQHDRGSLFGTDCQHNTKHKRQVLAITVPLKPVSIARCQAGSCWVVL